MNENNKVISGSLFILASIAVAFILNFSQPIMIPFVIALLLRVLIDPIIDFQTIYLRVHRFIAVFISICLIILLFSIIVPFIVSSVATFLESAEDYNQKVIILVEAVLIKLQEFDFNINKDTIRNTILELPITNWATAVLSNSANFISKFLLVVIITLFLLLGTPPKNTSDEWNDIIRLVKKYIFTKFLTSAFTGAAAGIIYWFFGLELALIFGTLTFILNFIPVIGSIIAVLLPLPIAFLQYNDPTFVILIIILPTIVHQIVGNFLEPKIFGESFGLHPITIILSLIFWGMIWGFIGVLLAAPLTAIIRITFERFETTKQIARLLEGKVHLKQD